jgi:hypothetical protein
MTISHSFHLVDRLPHGAAALVVDDQLGKDADVHTYLSREFGVEARMTAAGDLWTYISKPYEHIPVEQACRQTQQTG